MKHNYESDELIHEINLLENTFDIVRLVDILKRKQCIFSYDKSDIQYKNYKCYAICQKNHLSSDCILLKAFQDKSMYTKFEFIDNDIYYFVAKYVRVNEFDLVLELVNKMSINNMLDYNRCNKLEAPIESVTRKKVKIGRKIPIKKNITHSFDQLLQGIHNNEFYLLYQPKVENVTGHVIGVEALIRWKKNNEVALFPESFISEMEKNNSIHLIDFYVLLNVIEQIRNWEKCGERIIPIAINMCCSTLLREDFFEKIDAIMGSNSYAQYIEIEITERNIPLDKMKELSIAVEKLKAIGFHIALDDFGAYSAHFPLVFELNINTLKIDKSMIANLKHNVKVQKILENIFSTCKAFDICVVVEGVEEKEQLDILIDMGNEFSQGYYFSKPTSISEIKPIYE